MASGELYGPEVPAHARANGMMARVALTHASCSHAIQREGTLQRNSAARQGGRAHNRRTLPGADSGTAKTRAQMSQYKLVAFDVGAPPCQL